MAGGSAQRPYSQPPHAPATAADVMRPALTTVKASAAGLERLRASSSIDHVAGLDLLIRARRCW